jgi:hypothetical protein
MLRAECSTCHNTVPMNDTVKVDDCVICQNCTRSYPSVTANPAAVSKNHDPTICAGCGADFGSSTLATLQSGIPVCEPCRQAFMHRPYPDWVKLSFAGLIAIAILSIAVEWRFTAAYFEAKKSGREAQKGNFQMASMLMASAAQHVPESPDLKVVASFYRGIVLLNTDQSADAIPHLKAYQDRFPGPMAADLVLQAEIGAAFDRADYDAFLTKCQQRLQQHTGDAMATAAVASAYACKYVATNDESYKAQALQTLEQAKSLAGGNEAGMKDYESRILCRLETHEVLSSSEYAKRYPNGWKGGSR